VFKIRGNFTMQIQPTPTPPPNPNWYQQPPGVVWYQQPQPRTRLHYTIASRILLIISLGLAAIAFLAFTYVGLSYMSDQGNFIQLAADAYSIIKMGIIGFVCFFSSYMLLLVGLIIRE